MVRNLVLSLCAVLLFGCSSGGDEVSGGAAPPAPASESATTGEAPSATEDAAPPSERGGGGGRSCQQIAGQLVAQLNTIVAQVQNKSLADVLSGNLLTPGQRQQLQRVQASAQQAGCSQQELTQLLQQRADQIGGDGPVANAVREALRSGGGLPF